MNIIEPTPKEKDRALENIISRGLVKPKFMWAFLCEMARALGFRYIFWDMAQTLLLIVVTLAGTLPLLLFMQDGFTYTATFALAPLLFIIILLFSETIERSGSLYELKMTCKYTIRQITAFRVVCFSFPGIAFCVCVTAYGSQSASELLRLLPLALSALFLCAFLSLFCVRRLAQRWAYALAIVIWAAVTLAPALIFREVWEMLLSRLPVAVTLSAAILSAVLFVLEIRRLLRTREDFTYVIG